MPPVSVSHSRFPAALNKRRQVTGLQPINSIDVISSLQWQITTLESKQKSLIGAAASMAGLRKRVQELRAAALEREVCFVQNIIFLIWLFVEIVSHSKSGLKEII